jgi:diguanylate cyclase (GGDEF)-like protein
MSAGEIILVEDDAAVARLVAFHLQREGYAIRVAWSIDAAHQLMREVAWDVLILDRRLPDGDGIELCNEVRAANPHAYILILTGEATEDAKLAGFGCGADDYMTKPFQVSELLARIRAGLRIVELQKELLASNRQLEELSRTDPLTGLLNRRALDDEIATRFAHARRYQRPLSVVMLDVDHFKKVNDTFGHPAGDRVLQGVGEVLRRCSRQTDFIARYGGEEFVVLLPETPPLEALQFAEKIRAEVAATPLSPARVTVSLGVASYPHSYFDTPEELLAAADQALYRAKQEGRNRVELERRIVPREAEVFA